MTPEISFPENGELTKAEQETVDRLVDLLAERADVEPSDLPPLSIEHTDNSIALRPDEPLFGWEQGTRYRIRAVSRSDSGVVSTGLRHAPTVDD
jgi:hypothetical protein